MLLKMPEQKRAERSSASQKAVVWRQAAKTQPSAESDVPCVFVYGSVVGGVGKRAADILVALLTAPIWMLAVLTAAAVLRLRKAPRRPVLSAHRRIGFGGKSFKSWRMNATLPSAEILPLPGCAASPPPAQGTAWRIAWIELIERLPEMWSVLRGDMSLVGPRPLTAEAFGALGWPRKYYASARPGFVSANHGHETRGSPKLSYRHYQRDWSFAVDMRVLQGAAKQLARAAKGAAPDLRAIMHVGWRKARRGLLHAAAPIVALVCLVPSSTQAQPRMLGHTLHLAFADEFDTLSLRRNGAGTWSTSFGYGGIDEYTLPANSELQLYVDENFTGSGDEPMGFQPFEVRDGMVDIIGNRVTEEQSRRMWSFGYTSGLLTTRESFSQQYGYFEMRARLPAEHGMWPAFWLLPVTKGWPPEIDIMEALGREPDAYYAGIHAEQADGQRIDDVSRVTIPGPIGEFHVYGVLWDRRHLTFYLDGRVVRRLRTPDDMHQPMYILVNMAIGGNWAESPQPHTRLPARMTVDYVHAYSLSERR